MRQVKSARFVSDLSSLSPANYARNQTALPLERIQRIEALSKPVIAAATMALCPSCDARRSVLLDKGVHA
jgi:hypothetical protein